MNGLAHAAAWERLVGARVAHVSGFVLYRVDVEHRVVSDDRAYATPMAVPMSDVQSDITGQL